MKPANILLTKNGDAKLCDFGWARQAPDPGGNFDPLSQYVAARWYRCPEMLFGAEFYTTAVDMWAIGCVTAEMYGDTALFDGTSTIDMVTKILELTGKPMPGDVETLNSATAAQALEPVAPGPAHLPLDARLPDETSEMHDFVELLLQWSPEKRLTASEALEHPYVGAHHNPDDEPNFGRVIRLEIPDTTRVTPNWYRDQIYADAMGVDASKRKVIAHRKKAARDEEDMSTGPGPGAV